jgi:hypothetical protein
VEHMVYRNLFILRLVYHSFDVIFILFALFSPGGVEGLIFSLTEIRTDIRIPPPRSESYIQLNHRKYLRKQP